MEQEIYTAIQSILNVTKGIVADGRSFFEKAFGENINEFYHLLFMPETYIVYRKVFEHEFKLTGVWRKQFDDLMHSPDADLVKEIIISNNFNDLHERTSNEKNTDFYESLYDQTR